MKLPDHLFISSTDGGLYDTRKPRWSDGAPLRAQYCWTFTRIETAAQLKATLRAGPYAWPGGYPLFFVTDDGAALSFETVRKQLRNVIEAIKTHDSRGGWRVRACDVNWEDSELTDDYTGAPIESAHGEESKP